MRELKFRAWVYYGQKLEKPHYSRDYESLDRFFEDHDENDTDQCIEEYTGLKDKNGKEIYEGDIVKYDVHSDTIGVVKYDAPDFVLDNELGELFLKGTHQEVIGNIHENKELLEEE